MSSFDEASRVRAHNACGDAVRRLLDSNVPREAALEHCCVEMDGCTFRLTVIAEHMGDEIGWPSEELSDRPRKRKS